MTRVVAVLWAALALAPGAAGQDPAPLVARLGSEDAQTRLDAYGKLGRMRSPEVMAMLAKALPDLPLQGATFAVHLLEAYPWGETTAVWKKLAGQGGAFVHAAAAAALWRQGDKTQGPALAAAIGQARREERLQVLGRLHGIEDPAVVAAVRGYVRAGADENVLGQALELLLQWQKGRDVETIAAAEALIPGGGAGAAIALAWLVAAGEGGRHAEALAGHVRESKAQLYQITRFLARASLLSPPLVDALAERLAAVRSEYDVGRLVPLLQKHAPHLLDQALKGHLEGGDAKLRRAALEALAAVPGALEPKKLQAMLASDDAQVALVAADTLRRMDDAAGFDRVLALATTPGKDRVEAVRVLGGFRDARAIPPLLDAFACADAQVRRHAVTGLQTLLPDLFPYRRFDLERTGVRADAPDAERAEGLRLLRAWWVAPK